MRSLKRAWWKVKWPAEDAIQDFVTWAAYRFGMDSPSTPTLEGDELVHCDTLDDGRVVYWHSGLRRFFVAEAREE